MLSSWVANGIFVALQSISVRDQVELGGKPVLFVRGLSSYFCHHQFLDICILSAHDKFPVSALDPKVSATTANNISGSRVDWRFALHY
jgi:hypothetical protein